MEKASVQQVGRMTRVNRSREKAGGNEDLCVARTLGLSVMRQRASVPSYREQQIRRWQDGVQLAERPNPRQPLGPLFDDDDERCLSVPKMDGNSAQGGEGAGVVWGNKGTRRD